MLPIARRAPPHRLTRANCRRDLGRLDDVELQRRTLVLLPDPILVEVEVLVRRITLDVRVRLSELLEPRSPVEDVELKASLLEPIENINSLAGIGI